MPLRCHPPTLTAVLCLVACSGHGSTPHDAGRIRDAETSDADAAAPERDAGRPAANDAGSAKDAGACAADGCTAGVWTNVTPAAADLTHDLDCGNYGTQSIQLDPARPSDLYTLFMCQGIWRSSDYGRTWTGPINTGDQGAMVGDCAGGISMAPHDKGTPAILYAACIRGNGLGFWASSNAGVDWTRYTVAPGGARQDFYPPVVDPYDARHLLMAGHEMNVLVESVDAGHNWTLVTVDSGMNQNGGTAGIFFIDTGAMASTRTTILWIAQQSDAYGTWRTTNAGKTWTRVDKNEHPHGLSQIYQPDGKGVVYMAGAYSQLGWGVLRSADYGVTWMHVGGTGNEAMVFGTSKNVYAMNSGAVGLGSTLDPSFESAAQPGTGTWTMPGTPKDMKIGAAQAVVTSEGGHAVIVTANWSAGLWRYIEP